MSCSEFEIEADDSRGTFTVVIPRGELDFLSAPRLRELFFQLLNEGRQQIVVDLRRVEFMDSSGLGALVSGLKRFRAQGGDLSLVCQRPSILRLLQITGLTSVFVIAAGIDDLTA